MRCADFQERWQILLDQRREPQDDESLRAHAEVCEGCSEILRIQAVLFREIKRSKHAAGLHSQIGLHSQPGPGRAAQSTAVTRRNAQPSRIIGKGSRSRQSLARALSIGLAVAGSLLVIVIPAWRHSTMRVRVARHNSGVMFSGRQSLPPVIWVTKPSPAARLKTGEAEIPRPGGTTEVRGVAHNAVAHNAVAHNAVAHNAVDHWGITSDQEALRKLMQDMAARLSDVPEEQLEPLDRIAGGFRPLANTLGAAWDALRRTIPVGRSQAIQDPQAVLGWPGLQAFPA